MVVSTEKSEPLILAIETATRSGGVAVARGEQVLAARAGEATVSHSMNLIQMIEGALQEAGVRLSEIDLFAVAEGPGSFTGLRIGLATVKAFAAHLNRKVAGVSTLAAVAHASRANGEVVALLPAGRGEVFAQRFSVTTGEINPLDEAAHLSPGEIVRRYGEQSLVQWAGEGVEKFHEFLRDELARTSGEIDEGTIRIFYPLVRASGSVPLAASVAVLALKEYREGKLVAPEDLRAIYVRASDAEINEQWLRQKAQQPTQA